MIKWVQQGIDSNLNAAEIVRADYRTADVFKKYKIEYCCGIKLPLKFLCQDRGIPLDDLLTDLDNVKRTISLPSGLSFQSWRIDFITEYISNIHHQYLVDSLPRIQEYLNKFVKEHQKKFPFLQELANEYSTISNMLLPHIRQEEEIIFPYIRQIAHAYESNETYARLLVRTLRKPVETLMHQEHDFIEKVLFKFRKLTNNYQAPDNACTSHRLTFSYLKELDDDLVQHLFLENEVLFPRAIAMEKELLQKT